MVLFYDFKKVADENLSNIILNGLRMTTDSKTRDKGRLYASDSTMCELKAVLSSNSTYTGLSDPIKYFYTDAGKQLEETVIRGIDNSGALLYADYKLPDIEGANIGGKVDAIIYYRNRVWVLEIKQVGTLPTKPTLQHESQALFYSAVTGLPSLVFYVDRKVSGFNTGLLHKEFIVNTSYEKRYSVLQRVVMANLYNERMLIPDKPAHMKKTYCKNCPFYDLCYDNDEPDFIDYERMGFLHATFEQTLDIQNESAIITNRLMQRDKVLDRARGTLKFIGSYGRPVARNTSGILSGSWDNFYVND